MASVTKTVHVKVLTFDPAQRKMIPVPEATLLCEDTGWLWDPNLSDGTAKTDADGKAAVDIKFDEGSENKLNPFFTVTVPEGKRSLPAGVEADFQVKLPEEWETRHGEKRRIPKILDYADPANPLEIFVGLDARLRVAYADLEASGKSNPLALPEGSPRVYLTDQDFLSGDDTLSGFLGDPRTGVMLAAGEPGYPYFDLWPTAPCALDGLPPTPRSWIDPPGAPVGSLGGGSFKSAGPLAVDGNGFVFLIDGNRVHRFYPDGTLCQTITAALSNPGGLAVDQYRNLFVADTGNDRIAVFRPHWKEHEEGIYKPASTPFFTAGFKKPRGLAVVPDRGADREELLAVADTDNAQVQVLRIRFPGVLINRLNTTDPELLAVSTFGTVDGVAHFQEPVGVAADRQRRLFVCDRKLHRVSRWSPDASGTSFVRTGVWGKGGGVSGAGAQEFNSPEAIAVDSRSGYVYVAESGNRRVQRLNAESGDQLVHWLPTYSPALAQPFTPASVAVDARGEVYIADAVNRRVLRGTIFGPTGVPLPDGTVPSLVGSPWTPADDPAHLQSPGYVHFAPDGRLWVADTGNDRVIAFSHTPQGVLDTKLLDSAGLEKPMGLATDKDGRLFVVDSGHGRVVPYDPAGVAQPALGSPGPGDNQFREPHGIAIDLRAEPVLYVADYLNDRVQVLKPDGSFTGRFTTAAGTAFKRPEDVAVDAKGNLFVADTGNARIVQIHLDDKSEKVLTLNEAGQKLVAPCGVSIDPEGALIVTDRDQRKVYRLQDGKLAAYWDLQTLVRRDVSSNTVFDAELSRLLVFQTPVRAVLNDRGLLAVADQELHRIRLVRTASGLELSLFDLGEGLPDLSFRAAASADWSKDLALKLEVGNEGWFCDDVCEFTTPERSDFSDDHYELSPVLGSAGEMNGATNVMSVVRMLNRWLKHITRGDEEQHRWGTQTAKPLKMIVDLIGEKASEHPWGANVVRLRRDTTGRGFDAWDDPVIAHETAHWVFDKSVLPFPPFEMDGDEHDEAQITSENLAILEGYAEFIQFFWGSEFGSIDRVRGYRVDDGDTLLDIGTDPKNLATILFGGPSGAPTWDAPGQGLKVEGYFANALWQIHHVLVEPGILFADSPAFWYRYNTFLTDAQSALLASVLRKSLRMFPTSPSDEELQQGSRMYLGQLLAQAHLAGPGIPEIVQSIYELNNQLLPSLKITEGTSSTAPGTPLGDQVNLKGGEVRNLIVQVRDGSGMPLQGYSLYLKVDDDTRYTFPDGPQPEARHGLRSPAVLPAGDRYRVTNSHGIVNLTFTAPALAAGSPPVTDVLRVIYQPDFDTDETFSPPGRTDNREKTLRQLYLYELRAASKTWKGTGNNLGAKVSRTVTFKVQAS